MTSHNMRLREKLARARPRREVFPHSNGVHYVSRYIAMTPPPKSKKSIQNVNNLISINCYTWQYKTNHIWYEIHYHDTYCNISFIHMCIHILLFVLLTSLRDLRLGKSYTLTYDYITRKRQKRSIWSREWRYPYNDVNRSCLQTPDGASRNVDPMLQRKMQRCAGNCISCRGTAQLFRICPPPPYKNICPESAC